ncbi:hypothetical protein TURU_133798 [Turdus rufiventris]|nr:hypothetical protein TURU_133798 [Turdus rufiventris]
MRDMSRDLPAGANPNGEVWLNGAVKDWEKPNNSTLNPRFQPPQEPQRAEQPLTPNLCGNKKKKREIRRGVPPLKKKREILKGLLLMEKQGKSSRDNSPMKEVRFADLAPVASPECDSPVDPHLLTRSAPGDTRLMAGSVLTFPAHGTQQAQSTFSQDNIVLKEIRSDELPFQRRERKGNGKDRATGVWNCNTSKRLKFLLSSFSAILGQSELLSTSDMQEMTPWQ